jgi:hypothetical protein
MRDTSKKMEERYRKMLMSLTPRERVHMTSRMYDSARKLVIAGLLHEEPNLDAQQLKWRFFLRVYGSDFTLPERERIKKKILNEQRMQNEGVNILDDPSNQSRISDTPDRVPIVPARERDRDGHEPHRKSCIAPKGQSSSHGI